MCKFERFFRLFSFCIIYLEYLVKRFRGSDFSFSMLLAWTCTYRARGSHSFSQVRFSAFSFVFTIFCVVYLVHTFGFLLCPLRTMRTFNIFLRYAVLIISPIKRLRMKSLLLDSIFYPNFLFYVIFTGGPIRGPCYHINLVKSIFFMDLIFLLLTFLWLISLHVTLFLYL